MKKIVLVLTNSKDGEHSDIVITKLRARDENVVRFDSDLLASGALRVRIGAGNDTFKVNLHSSEFILDPGDIKSVWYRRPLFFNSSIKDRVQREYAESELANLLLGLMLIFPKNAFWMNHPANLDRARLKIPQLRLAQELGFTIPRTLVTNDPDEARAFFDACDGKMVFKAINRETMDYGSWHLNVPTTLVTEQHLDKIGLVRRLPSLFQETIEKQAEIRVTIVGNQLFPVRVEPKQGSPDGVDWRHPETLARLTHESTTLPADIEVRCFALAKTLGLEFGAIDLVVTRNGQLIFLEINPNGQWYWIEHLTGVLISDAIADKLSLAETSTERR